VLLVPGHKRKPRGPGRGGNEGVRGAEAPPGVFLEEAGVSVGELIGKAEAVVPREERQDSSAFGGGKATFLKEFLPDQRNVVASVERVIEEALRMGKPFQVINENIGVNQE